MDALSTVSYVAGWLIIVVGVAIVFDLRGFPTRAFTWNQRMASLRFRDPDPSFVSFLRISFGATMTLIGISILV